MKRVVFVALLCMAALVATDVAVATNIEDATKALKKGQAVFVVSGLPGTTADTAGEIEQQLSKGDHVAIVMLPADSGKYSTSAAAQAEKLDEQTGRKLIIGLAVGDEVIARASFLPAGVATDLMQRAQSVSVNTLETLRTFIGNVHEYQLNNPGWKKPLLSPPKPQPKSESSDSSIWPVILGVVLGMLLVVILSYKLRQSRNPNSLRSPEPVRNELQSIRQMSSRISDDTVRHQVDLVIKHTEAYFRFSRARGEDQSAEVTAFRNHLTSIRSVLERYLMIEAEPYYYDNADESLHDGETAIADFADFVLRSIKRGNRRGLLNYNVDTRILSAQRYS